MKKKVKILKNGRGIGLDHGIGGTFLPDADVSFAIQTSNTNSDRDDHLSKEGKLENMPKKKKALNKKDGFNSGLKYSAPSQRNHSSVYE
jgi:hypothetical protein